MYKSAKDPQIEKDMRAIESSCDAFAKKWGSDLSYIKDMKKLHSILSDWKKPEYVMLEPKPIVYFILSSHLDQQNTFFAGQITKLMSRFTSATNKILFFELTLGKIPEAVQKKILKDPAFAEFHYFLQRIWIEAKHRLSEPEEKILALKRTPAYELWVNANEKLIAGQSIMWKGKPVPFHKASGMIATLPSADRKKLHGLIVAKMKEIAFLSEAELNAVCINKKIDDDLRGFAHPYSATFLDYENDESTVKNLVSATQKAYGVSHRLHALKARIMGVKQLHAYDLSMNLSARKQSFTFEQGVAIVRAALEKAHPVYLEIFDRFLSNGQIDVYSRVGKMGGGYCWSGVNRPTYVLLNWTDDLRSVMTLAHEMGHAIHGELSKKQGVLYEGHTTATAETASTLFESFTFEEIKRHLSGTDRQYAEYNYLQDANQTIFRQIACFLFEEEMHTRVRADGQISKEDLAKMMQRHLQAQIGPVCRYTEDDAYMFVRWSHLRLYFYTYAYAYGRLISQAMYDRYAKDPSFIEQINVFLSSGSIRSSEEIFKLIGIDVTHEDFWKEGLRSIDRAIVALEKEIFPAKKAKKAKTRS